MNKSGFLSGLESRLKGLPQEEIKKDYRLLFGND